MAEVLTDEPVAAKGGNHASGTAGAEVDEAGTETIEDNEPDWSSSVPFGVLSDKTGHMPNNSTTNAIEAMVNGQIAAGEVGDQYDQYKPAFEKKADASLHKQMDAAGFSAEDKQKAEALQDAVIKGDKKALEQAVASMSPEQLKSLAGEVQKNLNALHADVTLKTIGDGSSLFLQKNGAANGLVVGKDGAKPVAVKYVDGQPYIDNSLTPIKDAQDVAKSISNSATFNAEVLAKFKYPVEAPLAPEPAPNIAPAESNEGLKDKDPAPIRWR